MDAAGAFEIDRFYSGLLLVFVANNSYPRFEAGHLVKGQPPKTELIIEPHYETYRILLLQISPARENEKDDTRSKGQFHQK